MARRTAAAALAFAATVFCLTASALELRVLSAGAVEPGMRPALAAFESESGHTIRLTFAAAPELRKALRAAPVADLIVVTSPLLAELGPAATASEASLAPIGRVGIGVAIRNGAEVPDIASAETLAAALASAESVVFNRASTGLYIEAMLPRLGLADAVNAKATRYGDGASVMRHLAAGTARREFGFAAMTEIVLFRDQGIRLVGPLPAALQNYTGYVAMPWPGVVPADPARAAALAALVRHLQAPEARATFASAGIEPLR